MLHRRIEIIARHRRILIRSDVPVADTSAAIETCDVVIMDNELTSQIAPESDEGRRILTDVIGILQERLRK